MKNLSIKKILRNELFILLFIILLGYLIHMISFSYFKRLLIHNNQYLVGTLIEKHPELEVELIHLINHMDFHDKKNLEVLEKYQLDDIDALNELDYIKDNKHVLWNIELSYLLVAFILFNIPYLIYLYRQIKQIRKIRNELSKAFHTDFFIELSDYEEGELANLKNDLQKVIIMLRDYNELVSQDKLELEKILSDISHQLKTPLTSMYMINEFLMNDSLSPIQRQELLLKNRKQLERIEWLVTSLLKISRLDNGVIELKKKEVSTKKLIDDATAPLLIPIELKRQKLKIIIDTKTIKCDSHWTTEALINLIKNAYEHTNEEGVIKVQVCANPIYDIIKISDNGEGISKKDLPHIFERFYKSNNKTDSIGIGLNMAKTIIEKQNGIISVESKKNHGTTFTIKFYKNDL